MFFRTNLEDQLGTPLDIGDVSLLKRIDNRNRESSGYLRHMSEEGVRAMMKMIMSIFRIDDCRKCAVLSRNQSETR